MPKLPRTRKTEAASARTSSTDTALNGAGSTTTNIDAIMRRHRYEKRLQRRRDLRMDEIYARQRELRMEISTQAENMQQYMTESLGGNYSTRRVNQTIQTADQLIVNIQRLRDLEREAYTERLSSNRAAFEQLEQHQFDDSSNLKRLGNNDRSIRMLLRSNEDFGRSIEDSTGA